MFARIWRAAAGGGGWLARRPGLMFLTAGDERLSSEPPGRFVYAWAELMLVSLAWGLANVGLWAAAWKLFGEPLGRAMPAAVVAAVMLVWPFRRAAAAAVKIVAGADSTARAIVSGVLVVVLSIGLLSLRTDYYRPDAPLPPWIAWFRPWVKLYRVLILMPLWGGWAMVVIPQFRRLGAGADRVLAGFVGGCTPLAAAAVMGLLLGVTITYFNFLPWEQLTISAVTIITALAGGALLCRRAGGLSRKALLAANIITQLAFLLACLATWNMLVW